MLVSAYVKPEVLPALPVLSTPPKPKYSSDDPAGVRLGRATVVDEALVRLPAVSSPHTVPAPSPAVNSWAEISTKSLETLLEKLKLIFDDPVVVTVPIQSSSSLG